MRKTLTAALIALACLIAPAAPAQAPAKKAETLAISAEGSKISFVGKKVVGSHDGGFKKFGGTIELVENDSLASKVTVEIDVNSIFTDSDRLTGHLKSPDFFDAAKFPKATFTSKTITAQAADGNTHQVGGELEIHGIKKTIVFPATIKADASGVTATATFKINRKDFGMNYPGAADNLIQDDVAVTFNVVAPRKKG